MYVDSPMIKNIENATTVCCTNKFIHSLTFPDFSGLSNKGGKFRGFKEGKTNFDFELLEWDKREIIISPYTIYMLLFLPLIQLP